MKKIIPIIFCLLLINFTLIIAMPPSPHGFYGTVQFRSGGNVPDGYIITGEVDGVVTGSCEVIDGKYDLVVVDENDGGEIKFYIQGKEADQTSIFKTFEVTELNLTIESNLDFDDDFCGDNSCNNGETCSSCSIDCGQCQSTSSGGGGSSGGSSSTSSENTITQTQDKDGNINLNLEPEKNETEEQEITRSGITGAVIGFAKSPGGITTGVLIVVFCAIAFFGFKKGKLEKKNSEEEIEESKIDEEEHF